MRHLAGIVTLGLLVTLVGCATPEVAQLERHPPASRAANLAGEVPFFAQEKYYCGPAALAMTLAWSGVETDQQQVAGQVYTPGREGTLPSDLISGARRQGRMALPVRSLTDLVAELEAGHPVIVFQNLGLNIAPRWHFAVAVGYDLEKREMILHSGLIEAHRTRIDTFARTWARAGHWALLVLPPDKLPARLDIDVALKGAAGLERADRNREAAIAYETLAAARPDNFAVWFGLGNARFALGQFAGAEGAYRNAIAKAPARPEAWNNLALALAELDRPAEALEAARKAVTLAGDDAEIYRRTLSEIGAARS